MCIFCLIIAFEPPYPIHPTTVHTHTHTHTHTHMHTQVPLEETLQKQLTYEFHSASYQTMVKVITALKISAEHLVKVWLLQLSTLIKQVLTYSLTPSLQGHFGAEQSGSGATDSPPVHVDIVWPPQKE